MVVFNKNLVEIFEGGSMIITSFFIYSNKLDL